MKNLALKDIQAVADITTPLGPMTAAATARGLAALWFDARERYAAAFAGAAEDPAHPHIAAARRWLQAYWADPAARAAVPDARDAPGAPGAPESPEAADLPDVALDLQGTLFQRAVWRELRRIPRGQTRSYGQVAAAVGAGAVARATGAACGANPVALIVPCHRVIGANGSLTGFAAGLPRKQALLQHEGLLLL